MNTKNKYLKKSALFFRDSVYQTEKYGKLLYLEFESEYQNWLKIAWVHVTKPLFSELLFEIHTLTPFCGEGNYCDS
jgi:hypothetical protein